MKNTLSATPIQTSVFKPGMSLNEFLWTHLQGCVQEKTVVAVTSKIISLAEGRLVSRAEISKGELIRREADVFLCETVYGVCLTVKDGLVIPSAGIDESNSETDAYILYPEKPYDSAQRIYEFLKAKSGVSELGVVITDSHTNPLRRGVTGVALAYYGFRAIRNLVGESDLFGRKLKMTSVNVLDSLAGAAVYVMGEAAECQPIALVESSQVEFCEMTDPSEITIPLDQDLYGPLLSSKSVVVCKVV